MRARKKKLGDWRKNRSENRAKMHPLPREVHGEIDEYERAAASEAKNGRLFEKQLYPRVYTPHIKPDSYIYMNVLQCRYT